MKEQYYIQWEYCGNMQRRTKWERIKEKGKAWSKGKLINTIIEYGREVQTWPWQERWIEADYKY